MSKCEVKRCRNESAYIYYRREVCEKHWCKHSNEKDKFNLKKEFDIKE